MKENGSVTQSALSNEAMATNLEAVAELLDAHDANPYRVQAYRTAAVTLRNLDKPAGKILEQQGLEGLVRLPGIGQSIAHSIEQMVHTGKLNLVQRLRGETDPERILTTVPTIGDELAHRIHEQLGIEALVDLQAAYDGRLAQVPGFGRKRVRAVRESLAGRLRRRRAAPKGKRATGELPPVKELLDIDRQYRQQAAAGKLPRIAPRQFNPTNEAWLPVLHTERGNSHYTALFSNTARAHQLDMIRDWVVIYRDDQDGSGQWTVVTSQFGGLAFCEASGKCLIRWTGTDPEMIDLARENTMAISAGHSFIIFLGEGFFPVNVLNAVKQVPEVCHIFCATANPTEVIVAETEQGRAILGVVDGFKPIGVEDEQDIAWRKGFLRQIGYKL